ncbi:MAG: hypothetical protein ACYDAD_14620 [Acidimicrobiales bacterium]
MAKPQQRVAWRRQPSYAQHDRTPLPWPTRDFTLSTPELSNRQLPQEFLIGEGCPSFPDPFTAFRAFFEGNFSLMGAPSPSTDLAVIRWVDDRAWLGPVHLGSTAMTVEVCGNTFEGCGLELFDVEDRQSIMLDWPGTITLPLHRGPPQQGWLWLKRSTDWLDYRPLAQPWAPHDQLALAGVAIEVPEEPQVDRRGSHRVRRRAAQSSSSVLSRVRARRMASPSTRVLRTSQSST